MIQKLVLDRIKKNALALAQLSRIKAKLPPTPKVEKPILLAPRLSKAEVEFILSMNDTDLNTI